MHFIFKMEDLSQRYRNYHFEAKFNQQKQKQHHYY